MKIKPKLHINIEWYLMLYFERSKPCTRKCFVHSCVHPQGGVTKCIYYKNLENQCTNVYVVRLAGSCAQQRCPWMMMIQQKISTQNTR